MIHLPCSVCGQPRTIQAMLAWLFDAPFCSEACLRDGQTSGRFGSPPPAGPVLASASSSITRCMRLLEHVAGGAAALDRAAADAEHAPMIGFAVGVVMGGIVGGMATQHLEAEVERARSRHEDVSWAMEQQVVKLVRELMALQGLGYPIAAQMGPLVTTYSTTPGTNAQRRAMHGYLAHIDRGLRVWIDELSAADG